MDVAGISFYAYRRLGPPPVYLIARSWLQLVIALLSETDFSYKTIKNWYSITERQKKKLTEKENDPQ